MRVVPVLRRLVWSAKRDVQVFGSSRRRSRPMGIVASSPASAIGHFETRNQLGNAAMRMTILVAAVMLTVLPSQLSGGIFRRKPQMNATDRVRHLLIVLRSHPHEAQRKAAAEELRDYDGRLFPEIAPALIEALERDGSRHVRREAAESLGKLRPATAAAAAALERARRRDRSLGVRLKALTALRRYPRVPNASAPPLEKSTPSTLAGGSPNEPRRVVDRKQVDREVKIGKPRSVSGPLLVPNQAAPALYVSPEGKSTPRQDESAGPILFPPKR